MKYSRIKKDSELVLNGVTFDTEYRDTSLQAVTMKDAEGRIVRIAMDSYNLYAMVPAAPTMVKRHKLAGTLAGLPVEFFFDNDYDANRAKSHYERIVNSDSDVALTVSVVEVPEDDATPTAPDIPF